MSLITLSRQERLKMFFNEYYFGVSNWMKFMRIVGGPSIIFLGLSIYQKEAEDKFWIGYGLLMVVFGIYYILKPLIWILVRWNIYKTISFHLEIEEDRIQFKEDQSESTIEFSKFDKIDRRRSYYSLKLNTQKIYLPCDKLNQEQIDILDKQIILNTLKV